MRYKRVESLNASAETSASSGKKIYARQWRERKKNKCMHAKGEPKNRKGPKRKGRCREGGWGKNARTESEQGQEDGDTMMENRREVGRPRKDEQTKCIRISLASVKTSDGASLEIFLVTTYRLWSSSCAETIHDARSMRHN